MTSLLPRTNKVVVVEPPKTLYIHVRCASNLNDCLNQLWVATNYARNNGREIVLEMPLYTGDLKDLMDFTRYPVKVHTNLRVLPEDAKRATFKPEDTKTKTQVLVHEAAGGGIQSAHVFRFIRFQPAFVERLKALPVIHSAIHVPASEASLDLADTDQMIKEFVSMQRERPLFLVSENAEKSAKVSKKYECFAKAAATPTAGAPVDLEDALADLMVLAAAKDLLCLPDATGKVMGLALLAKELHTKRLFMRDLIAGKPM
jgi:hypothetical protein